MTRSASPASPAADGNAPVTMTNSLAANAAPKPDFGTASVPAVSAPQTSLPSPAPAAAPLSASAGLAGAGGPVAGGMAASKPSGGEKPKEASADKLAEKKLEDKDNSPRPASATPPSLYFNPNLETDANGVATVRFAMPAGPSEYRLLIDALGQGRIGSRQELIVAQP